jgi:NAD(P)H-hydrate repair Nnr-like enzyme with NAD(P)H-hydrate dehydratase domain
MENPKSPSEQRHLTGLFRDPESTERALESATRRGYTRDEVTLFMTEDTRRRCVPPDEEARVESTGTKALEGAGTGAAVGGTAGGIVGALAAIGTSVVLPGLGLVIAGPLAAALAGAGAGGAAGTLIGALVGSGIPEDRARDYEPGLREGGIVAGVRPRSDEEAEAIRRDWEQHGEHVRY